MTHRVFSRNASSSRAIPVSKLIEGIIEDPVNPSYWGKNQSGMQAKEELDHCSKEICQGLWNDARMDAISWAETLEAQGAHKQIVNRILEPFSHINVVVTSTEWNNFFKLRLHEDAQPEIRILAGEMWSAMHNVSEPINLPAYNWHLPYITMEDRTLYSIEVLCKMSAARCARVSYNRHDGGTPSMEDDLKLFERLTGSDPMHLSPLEHQAMGTITPAFSGNFRGWQQQRKLLEL